MAIALLTPYLSPYRVPLYERLARRHGTEVLCYGGGKRYAPSWFANLDAQLAAAPFPARRLHGVAAALAVGRGYEAVIAPFAGGAILPAAYVSARRYRRPFIFWASVWSRPRSLAHDAAVPITRHIYRHADAVLAYGEHVRRYVGGIRGRQDDVFVAPQSVEPELFAREVSDGEIEAFRATHCIPPGPLALYVGRLVHEKGVGVLLDAWRKLKGDATLALIGDGPLSSAVGHVPRVRLIGPLPRPQLPAAYAAAQLTVLPSIPTPRFREPWGMVCNEAMHQSRPVIATSTVGAVAGGLVRDGETGLVVEPGDAGALAGAIEHLFADQPTRARLGAAGRDAVSRYTYEAMVAAFDDALAVARRH